MSQTETPSPVVRSSVPRPAREQNPKPLPPYHVVLLDDDDHTDVYVIEMLRKLFGHTDELAAKMTREVDDVGRVIVYTTHKEKAELKRDQIHAYGKDVLLDRCAGSMSAASSRRNEGSTMCRDQLFRLIAREMADLFSFAGGHGVDLRCFCGLAAARRSRLSSGFEVDVYDR